MTLSVEVHSSRIDYRIIKGFTFSILGLDLRVRSRILDFFLEAARALLVQVMIHIFGPSCQQALFVSGKDDLDEGLD